MGTMEKLRGHDCREVPVPEGQDAGEAGQECSRQEQDRQGLVRCEGEAEGRPFAQLVVALQVRQGPAHRQEYTQEAGGDPMRYSWS